MNIASFAMMGSEKLVSNRFLSTNLGRAVETCLAHSIGVLRQTSAFSALHTLSGFLILVSTAFVSKSSR